MRCQAVKNDKIQGPRHTRHRSFLTITSTTLGPGGLCFLRSQMTFATLRALQAIIGGAIDEIYAAYTAEHPSHSTPPSSPKRHRSPTPPLLSFSNHTLSSASHYSQSQSSNTHIPPSGHDLLLDFPDLNLPGDPSSPAEQLVSRPDIANAISRIISAASQLAVVVRPPLLTICDASMIVRPFNSLFSYFIL